ncbi:MAG: PilZ domain-containing protein [Candidatus Omnitrophica bacterium]|nr:PilZ domain-containing protein [Candidatus Omnitrophota bacterium]
MAISGEATYRIAQTLSLPVTVLTREMNRDGLHFVTTEKLNPGTVLELKIKILNMSEPFEVQGKVLWQRKVSSQFLLDTFVEFLGLSDSAAEHKLLAYISRIAEWKTVNREHVRCPMITDVTWKLPGRPEAHRAASGDIGRAGMKLFLSEDIPQNVPLDFSFAFPGNPAVCSVAGQVVWKSRGQTNFAGVKFLEVPPALKEIILEYIDKSIKEEQ